MKKLTLNRETLATLSTEAVNQVAGGNASHHTYCGCYTQEPVACAATTKRPGCQVASGHGC